MTHPAEERPAMHPSLIPPRQVRIGDAAAFVGTTPRAIRYYHQIGLLPEPERGADDRRRYGYAEMIRLLWIRRMADAGIALDDIRDAFADPAPEGAGADDRGTPGADSDCDSNSDVAGILARLEVTLDAQEAELRRQRAAVRRMRARGSRLGLLSDFVATRLEGLPAGSLRPADLDDLLVVERVLGPLGAALNATRYIAIATLPGLRAASDRIEAAEEALDDTVAVDDPRVAAVAAERRAFEAMLHAAIDASDLPRLDDELVDAWDALHPEGADAADEVGSPLPARSMTAMEAIARMPYDLSPARLRCMELAAESYVGETPAP
ncbi:MerR family transcriptional regulator [Clavibacter michiganensis subsp. phaseoli]|uniref:MerR family transcriptional regulator n=1 Tax=Clavibacter phaseoli TaxID=1734031 RepID=UPI001FB40D93|nr:MerR family transcriptional regulator [Clavibacter phaseoli]MCJ1711945.1 MerR family transcriptional regulator [Clavibacter phaseoli]